MKQILAFHNGELVVAFEPTIGHTYWQDLPIESYARNLENKWFYKTGLHDTDKIGWREVQLYEVPKEVQMLALILS